MDLPNIQSDLKARVAKGLNFGIEGLEDVLSTSSDLYNDYILLKSKYNDLMYVSSMNTLPYEQIEIGMDRLRGNILGIIDRLGEQSLRKEKVEAEMNIQALPTRRTNFFKLLDIHFQNLEAISYTETSGEKESTWQGREAVYLWYRLHARQFRNDPKVKEPGGFEHIRQYFLDYFKNEIGLFEVYFKNIRHMLSYAMESEIERQFFLNILKSLFSRYEMAWIFFYTMSGIDPAFTRLVRESQVLDEATREVLPVPEHWDLLHPTVPIV
ncbi:MAG: putative phage abortive infection protein [Saprospiraceae bacterium]